MFRLREVISRTLEKKEDEKHQSILKLSKSDDMELERERDESILFNNIEEEQKEEEEEDIIEPCVITTHSINSRISRFAFGAKYFREAARLRLPKNIAFSNILSSDNVIEVISCPPIHNKARNKNSPQTVIIRDNKRHIVKREDDDDDEGDYDTIIPSTSVILLVSVVPVMAMILIIAVMIISFFTGNNPYMRKVVRFFGTYKMDVQSPLPYGATMMYAQQQIAFNNNNNVMAYNAHGIAHGNIQYVKT